MSSLIKQFINEATRSSKPKKKVKKVPTSKKPLTVTDVPKQLPFKPGDRVMTPPRGFSNQRKPGVVIKHLPKESFRDVYQVFLVKTDDGEEDTFIDDELRLLPSSSDEPHTDAADLEAERFYDEFIGTEAGQHALDIAREKMDAFDPDEDEDIYDELEGAYDVWVEMRSWLEDNHGLTSDQLDELEPLCQEMIAAGLS